jgi:hypothetical protein
MNIPKGFDMDERKTNECGLSNLTMTSTAKNRAAGKYLVNKRTKEQKCVQSKAVECSRILSRGTMKMMYVLYTDDSVLAGPHKQHASSCYFRLAAFLLYPMMIPES